MCDDVLSCAKVESDADCAAPVYAVVPTVSRAAARAVTPDGTSTNRTADAGNAAREQTTRSSPAARREIFPKHPLGAHPRAPSPRSPVPPPAAGGHAADTDNSVDGGTPARPRSSARLGRHANVATGPPPADTPHRNTAPGHIRAGRTARSLSKDSAAAAATGWSLALKKIVDHAELDPRERQLPKGQVPERTSIPLRDPFYPLPYPSASLCFRLITRLLGRHFPAGQPPPPLVDQPLPWSAKWLNSRAAANTAETLPSSRHSPGGHCILRDFQSSRRSLLACRLRPTANLEQPAVATLAGSPACSRRYASARFVNQSLLSEKSFARLPSLSASFPANASANS